MHVCYLCLRRQLSYKLPGMKDDITSNKIPINGENISINFCKTLLLSESINNIDEFLSGIASNPIIVTLYCSEFSEPQTLNIKHIQKKSENSNDSTGTDIPKLDWFLRGQCSIMLNDIFTSKCYFEQIQVINTIFNDGNIDKQKYSLPIPKLNYHSINQTTLTVKYKLYLPKDYINKKLDDSFAFSRGIYRVKYGDEIINDINEAIVDINLKQISNENNEELKSEQLQEYKFSDKQMNSLDIITGIMILDYKSVTIIVEGKHNGTSIHELYNKIPKVFDENRQFLINENVKFKERLYPKYNRLCLKTVNIKRSIVHLGKSKHIYMRTLHSENAYNCHRKLSDIWLLSELKMAKYGDLFPSMNEIDSFETEYKTDKTDQVSPSKWFKNAKKMTSALNKWKSTTNTAKLFGTKITNTINIKDILNTTTKPIKDEDNEESSELTPLKQPIKSNKTIQKQRNYIKENIKLYSTDPDIIKQRKLDKQMLLESAPDITYLYGSQKLTNTAPGMYKIIKPNKNKWITEDGFSVIRAKKPDEFIQHPKKPHPARCEDLQQPYDEIGSDRIDMSSTDNNDGKPLFKPTNVHGGLFGMKGNDEYFKSVFITNEEEQIKYEKEMKAKAQKEWKDKVLVDDIIFRVHKQNERRSDKILGMDKYENILKDTPKKKSLQLYKKLCNIIYICVFVCIGILIFILF